MFHKYQRSKQKNKFTQRNYHCGEDLLASPGKITFPTFESIYIKAPGLVRELPNASSFSGPMDKKYLAAVQKAEEQKIYSFQGYHISPALCAGFVDRLYRLGLDWQRIIQVTLENKSFYLITSGASFGYILLEYRGIKDGELLFQSLKYDSLTGELISPEDKFFLWDIDSFTFSPLPRLGNNITGVRVKLFDRDVSFNYPGSWAASLSLFAQQIEDEKSLS